MSCKHLSETVYIHSCLPRLTTFLWCTFASAVRLDISSFLRSMQDGTALLGFVSAQTHICITVTCICTCPIDLRHAISRNCLLVWTVIICLLCSLLALLCSACTHVRLLACPLH